MSEIKPVSIKTAAERYENLSSPVLPDIAFRDCLKSEAAELRAALEASQNEVMRLQAELEEKRILLEKIETLCTHDYESKDDFIFRVKDSLSAQKGTE